ncbi:glycoside hydrolase family 53 protein [Polaribacter marinaquae]|uniref:Arabinogalactan endo-beta-1,4-galactanase n=1 Tax=Polaribacter marinaquae TaxID=1642819 RepID=A0ABZ2TPW8_9FLAO|nr:arabinogalactan endo-1,4-beta-galactosidase [Gaetbulibacter sp. 5U11]
MNKTLQILIALMIFTSCNKEDINTPIPESENLTFISAVDISSYPEISNSNPTFYDLEGKQNDFLTILKDNGINTVRLRLWVNPSNEHSGFNEVKQFSNTLRTYGFKIWLTIHYSDTWADPAHQETPTQWQGISFAQLKDSVYNYTEKIMNELKPNYIQIGNEINSGLLHPSGHISNNYQKFKELMNMGITAVRANSTETEIILHFAGIEGSDWFFNQVNTLDYDIIGLSYYPIWHGKSLNNLKTKMQNLSETHNKKIIIAETAYPFTLEWNDWTNNIVGLDEQLILPEYPATIEGQRKFINQIKTLTKELENGIGLCYWGAELIAWKENQSTDASPWENQALFNFDNKALPVLREFKSE